MLTFYVVHCEHTAFDARNACLHCNIVYLCVCVCVSVTVHLCTHALVAAYSKHAGPWQQCGLAARTGDNVLFLGEGDEPA